MTLVVGIAAPSSFLLPLGAGRVKGGGEHLTIERTAGTAKSPAPAEHASRSHFPATTTADIIAQYLTRHLDRNWVAGHTDCSQVVALVRQST